MTNVKFLADSKGVYGFCVSGHSSKSCDDELGKIVCASVSSAVYLVANTVTDIIGDGADAKVKDGLMNFTVKNPSDATYKLIRNSFQSFQISQFPYFLKAPNNLSLCTIY